MSLRVVCAWCEAVIEEGPAGALVSHGICAVCMGREAGSLGSPMDGPGAGADIGVSSDVGPSCLGEASASLVSAEADPWARAAASPSAVTERSPGGSLLGTLPSASVACRRAREAWARTCDQLSLEVGT